jgi:hypothetical protein
MSWRPTDAGVSCHLRSEPEQRKIETERRPRGGSVVGFVVTEVIVEPWPLIQNPTTQTVLKASMQRR